MTHIRKIYLLIINIISLWFINSTMCITDFFNKNIVIEFYNRHVGNFSAMWISLFAFDYPTYFGVRIEYIGTLAVHNNL